MEEINKRLRIAARAGSELELKALLREPGCDALAQDGSGWTALMYAARNGHEGCVGLLLSSSNAFTQNRTGKTALMWASAHGHEDCVRLLLPVSDALAQAGYGLTASTWARNRGHENLAQLIDAYAQAQSERAALEMTTHSKAPRGKAAFRM